jgi:transposase-like protein
MVNSQRGVNVKFLHICPNCNSKNIIKNGHHYGGKLQFLCKNCNKHFTEESAKGYPPSKIPFQIIAYLLYFRRKIPEFSNMRKYRRFVNFWLKNFDLNNKDVSRQTIHHWINKFDRFLDKVISFNEARDYCQYRLLKNAKVCPHFKTIPYRNTLKILEKKFGKSLLIHLIKQDEYFFKELVDIVSKHGMYSWEFLDKKFGGENITYQSVSTG